MTCPDFDSDADQPATTTTSRMEQAHGGVYGNSLGEWAIGAWARRWKNSQQRQCGVDDQVVVARVLEGAATAHHFDAQAGTNSTAMIIVSVFRVEVPGCCQVSHGNHFHPSCPTVNDGNIFSKIQYS